MRPADEGFGHSLTDLMASVAVMFLLIAAIFMLRSQRLVNAAEEEAQKPKQVREDATEQLSRLRDELRSLFSQSRKAIDVDYDKDKDPFTLTIIFSEKILDFPVGQSEPNRAGRETLAGIGRQILGLSCQVGVAETRQITLEGHTDNQGYPKLTDSESFRENVRLSASRAQAVYFLLRDAVSNDASLTACLDENFVVSGRGPVEPRGGADWRAPQTLDERERNRRVVIQIRLRTDSPDTTPPAVAGTGG